MIRAEVKDSNGTVTTLEYGNGVWQEDAPEGVKGRRYRPLDGESIYDALKRIYSGAKVSVSCTSG